MASFDLGPPAEHLRAASRGGPGDGVTSLLLGRDPHLAVVGVSGPGNDARIALAMRAGARGGVDQRHRRADCPGGDRGGRGQAILSGSVLRGLHRGLRADDPEA